jgi:DNA-binding response OmpR family regulator
MVVDDDPDTCALIVDILEEDDYEVHAYLSGEHALSALKRTRFDLILSDIKMHRVSGIDLLLHVRRMGLETEVILMTAYASLQTAIQALRGEAFDYLTKPFSLNELRQRVRQALDASSPVKRQPAVMHYQDLCIDQNARRTWIGEAEVSLTRLEFDVLAYLFARQGCAVTQEELLEQVWGCREPDERSIATVRTCIRRLRQKIGDDAHAPRYVSAVWGIGYKLGE